jgi:hypothetical protein
MKIICNDAFLRMGYISTYRYGTLLIYISVIQYIFKEL